METVTTNRLNQIIKKIKQNGLRLTPQRLAVLKILVSDQTHPTADEIYETVKRDFPMTSLATVYKTISVLKDLDELVELHSGGQAVRYDGVSGKAHPHLVCTSCGLILDAEFPGWNELIASLEKKSSFQAQTYRMDILGLCPNCQKKTLLIE